MQERAKLEMHCYVQLQIGKCDDPFPHDDFNSSSRPIENVVISKDLCNWCDRCHDGSNTKISNITREVTIGSLLWAVTGDVTSLTALVASLASSVQRSTRGSSAVTYREVRIRRLRSRSCRRSGGSVQAVQDEPGGRIKTSSGSQG